MSPEAVYLAMSVRNVGNGIAILDSWRFVPERALGREAPPLEEFHRLTRDLYIPVGDVGFWQGVFRDPGSRRLPGGRRCDRGAGERSPWTSSTATTRAASG